jgi:DNA-directed RNA polymerase specialized sigma24 family protein
MDTTFETDVMPVVERYARRRFRNHYAADEMVATAVILAWHYWSNRPQDFAASHWARIAVWHTFAGRDLPGCGTGAKDALHRAEQGSGMDEVTDRRPGPDKVAEAAELAGRLLESLSPRERQLAELLAGGAKGMDVAEAMHISPGRVSQIRSELMERLTELE